MALLNKVAESLAFRASNFAGAVWPDDFIVAHFNHGIRADSDEDEKLVAGLAAKYKVDFVSGKGNLSKETSEAEARTARYRFLNGISSGAQIVTAHHQDDLIETIAINLIRGTGWRGLAPMSGDVLRSLLDQTKAEITSYAINHGLDWHEDSTNFSSKYLRNRVRDMLVKMSSEARRQILRIYERQSNLRFEINQEIESEIKNNVEIIDAKTTKVPRYYLIMLPENVALEIINQLTCGGLTYPQLESVLLFTKTASPNKKMQFKQIAVRVEKREIILQRVSNRR